MDKLTPNQYTIYQDMLPVIILGAGGHAKVLHSLLILNNMAIQGVCAPELSKKKQENWRGINVVDEETLLCEDFTKVYCLVNAIGQQPGSRLRQQVFERFKNKGYYFPSLIHPNAYGDPMALIQEGAQIMAGAIIQSDTKVGKNSIINSGAIIDHDCSISDHVHVAPRAVICGNVHVECGAFIGSGSVVAPNIKIEQSACIGAGSSIVKDVFTNQKIVPAAVRYIDNQ